MNDILQLKGHFEQKSSLATIVIPILPNGSSMSLDHLKNLYFSLNSVLNFWNNQDIISDALVSVNYKRIITKRYRIQELLKSKGKMPNDCIVGAKYKDKPMCHLITYNVEKNTIEETLKILQYSSEIFEKEFGIYIDADRFNDKNTLNNINFDKYKLSKSAFRQIIVDAYYVSSFCVDQNTIGSNYGSIITFYKTNKEIIKVLEKIGIKITPSKVLHDLSVLLDSQEIELLNQKAPFLVAMATKDISSLSEFFSNETNNKEMSIPMPTIEPTIGVIDTLFDSNVYFSEWVDYTQMISDDIPIKEEDYFHGTAISSIIVDGPSLNPNLDDGCGRFKVKHFGVCLKNGFSSFSIIKAIEEIILANRNIKVWNLSLGSKNPVHENFISPEAALIDEIQYKYDVVFVISGTNKEKLEPMKKIGAAADSINSVVVNSVDFDNNPTDYSRCGFVLSFFLKPDVCYYGGTSKNRLRAYTSNGISYVSGTSFAAPWISRKMAYLIDVLGFTREVAKALLIDSAIGWTEETNIEKKRVLGHGVVPKHINEIIKSKNDEIKFLLSGVSDKFDTYNYRIPVPIHQNAFPYVAKATLCYFPKCSQNQGVDYTNTEFDLYFGRINKIGKIESINKNKQTADDDEESVHLFEVDARSMFRKWDNVKHIHDYIPKTLKPKKLFGENKFWGISIKTKERLVLGDGKGLHFGIVVTLKDVNGRNRIEEFIQSCALNGWLVSRINIETRLDIYNKINEDIEFN